MNKGGYWCPVKEHKTKEDPNYKTEIFVFEHLGENSTTPHSITDKKEVDVDLTEMVLRFYNCDDNHEVKVSRYQLTLVTYPKWMSRERLVREYIHYRYVSAIDGWKKLTPKQQQYLFGLNDFGEIYGFIKLLVSNLRSEFRISLRDQLNDYIDNLERNRERGYIRPFSKKQYDCLFDKWTCREAHQLSDRLYLAHRYG